MQLTPITIPPGELSAAKAAELTHLLNALVRQLQLSVAAPLIMSQSLAGTQIGLDESGLAGGSITVETTAAAQIVTGVNTIVLDPNSSWTLADLGGGSAQVDYIGPTVSFTALSSHAGTGDSTTTGTVNTFDFWLTTGFYLSISGTTATVKLQDASATHNGVVNLSDQVMGDGIKEFRHTVWVGSQDSVANLVLKSDVVGGAVIYDSSNTWTIVRSQSFTGGTTTNVDWRVDATTGSLRVYPVGYDPLSPGTLFAVPYAAVSSGTVHVGVTQTTANPTSITTVGGIITAMS